MTEVDEFDLAVIRDFIGQCCTDFVAFNEDRSDDGITEAERLYRAIGGED
ncbi:hypothetical protein AAG674_002905 [Salmonella enterica]|nr:hypothetical protein [Salmonella enterica]EHN4707278.1 hypothetical protein [Salmonella enterica]EJY5228262.1 hypothetical protein [Salmonella enterica]ELI0559707.1 hypothetical protein [Salmonella enterica]ELX3417273.1 hypothetical protein [Salmonella enterica]